VLVPTARRQLADGKEVAHAYHDAMRVLEVALAHAKGHEYGSVYEKGIAWGSVWSEVGNALALERQHETRPSWPTKPVKEPGLLGQYLMGNPRFDPDDMDEDR
jgi:hypothetical protein